MIDVDEVVNDIVNLSNMLMYASSCDEYKQIMCNISLLRDIYNSLTGEEYHIDLKRNLLYEGNEDKSICSLYRDYYLSDREFHDNVFSNAGDIFSNLNRYNEGTGYININEILSVLNDFLLSFNKDMYECYNYLLRNGYIDIYSDKKRRTCETNNIFMLDKRYILVNGDQNIDGLLSLGHEIGHAYSQSRILNNKAAYNDCNSFFEFYSSFIERMLINYLKENGLYEFDTSIVDLKYYQYLKKITNHLISFKKQDESYINNNLDKLANALIYFYGEYLALIKEYDYYTNKDETVERIDDYLKLQGLVSKEESLDILGISKEELLTGNKVRKILKGSVKNY